MWVLGGFAGVGFYWYYSSKGRAADRAQPDRAQHEPIGQHEPDRAQWHGSPSCPDEFGHFGPPCSGSPC